jgi:3-oxoacyl-[acyl-carrier protein] reductase
MLLKDKVALVTGSRRGIGKVIALKLAEEGADLIINDIEVNDNDDVIQEIRALGRKALAVSADITNKNDVIEMVEKALKEFSKIDILVNNAGIYPAHPFLEISEAEWDKVIDVNLKGTFLVTQVVASMAMTKANYGKIVNIASVDGKVPTLGITHYAAAKAGVISLTKSFAIELCQYNINSNAVAPGWVESETVLKGDRWKEAIKRIPSGRLGKLEEIAHAIVFLVRDESSYINGEILDVNGAIYMD